MNKRAWEDEALRESDERFPSGRWGGYWLQGSQRGRMELDLQFQGGRIFGDGRDRVGDFVVSGSYDGVGGGCSLHKAYLGQHTVEYDGIGSADGIRGAWTIAGAPGRPGARGGFHIWPIGAGQGDAMEVSAYATLTA